MKDRRSESSLSESISHGNKDQLVVSKQAELQGLQNVKMALISMKLGVRFPISWIISVGNSDKMGACGSLDSNPMLELTRGDEEKEERLARNPNRKIEEEMTLPMKLES